MTETSVQRRAAVVAAVLAAALILLTTLVALRWHSLVQLDTSTTRTLHDSVDGPGWAAQFFRAVSAIGQPRIAEAALGVVALGFAVRRQWSTAGWIVSSLLVTALGWGLLKVWVSRPRPAVGDQIDGWSYPSGHAGEIACACALLFVLTVRRLRPGRLRFAVAGSWLAVAALVGLSRLFLGAHYPSDVLGGWLVGVLVVLLLGSLFGVVPSGRTVAETTPSLMPDQLRTLAVIVNPTKVDSDAFRSKVSGVARVAGWGEPLWFETTVDDVGATMTRAAVAAGADVVVAAGGDGTVRVVCAEMAGTGVPVGVVPAGTGNLLARNLGIPLGRDQALEVVLHGRDRAIDLVQIKGDGLEATRFAVMAGMGLDAAIMAGAPDAMKRRMGWPAYVVAGMRHLRYPAVRVTISVDGSEPVHRKARTVLVGNVGSLTAGIPLLPDARIDDGVLDVVVIAPRRVVGWLSLLWRVLTRHPRIDERLDRYTGRSVVVTAATSTPRQLDGDIVGPGTEIHAEVEPGVLLVRVPR